MLSISSLLDLLKLTLALMELTPKQTSLFRVKPHKFVIFGDFLFNYSSLKFSATMRASIATGNSVKYDISSQPGWMTSRSMNNFAQTVLHHSDTNAEMSKYWLVIAYSIYNHAPRTPGTLVSQENTHTAPAGNLLFELVFIHLQIHFTSLMKSLYYYCYYCTPNTNLNPNLTRA